MTLLHALSATLSCLILAAAIGLIVDMLRRDFPLIMARMMPETFSDRKLIDKLSIHVREPGA